MSESLKITGATTNLEQFPWKFEEHLKLSSEQLQNYINSEWKQYVRHLSNYKYDGYAMSEQELGKEKKLFTRSLISRMNLHNLRSLFEVADDLITSLREDIKLEHLGDRAGFEVRPQARRNSELDIFEPVPSKNSAERKTL